MTSGDQRCISTDVCNYFKKCPLADKTKKVKKKDAGI